MKKLLCQMVICVLICTPAGSVMVSAQQPRPAGLRIVVLEGEDAVNIVQQKTAVRPLVEVRDSNNLPVAGAAVLFTIARTGGRAAASFANGQSAVTVTTDAAGRAASSPLQAIGNGAVRIDVQASYQGQVATTTINQTNFATPADAARAGRTPTQAAGAAAAGAIAAAAAAAGRGAGAGGAAGGAAAAGATAASTSGTVGVITGEVASSSGRKLSNITMQLLNQSGVVVGKTVSARNGKFTLPSASFDTYTLQCVHQDKVIGTASVALKAATQSVDIVCTSDAGYWQKWGTATGLAAAAVAAGTAAVVAAGSDASGSR